IDNLFDAQCRLAPDAIAVVCRDLEITYRRLQEQASALANRLAALSTSADIPIGLCGARSADAIIGLLAILRSGASYLPLDPAYPEQRLAAMIEDSGTKIVIAEPDSTSRFDNTKVTVVPLDASDNQEQSGTCTKQTPIASDNLAYVIYTSGSTGKPKGIAVAHRSVIRLIANANYVDLTPQDVVAQASTITFDAATFEIWGALLNGARLVITERETTLSPSLFGVFAKTHQITTLFLTTALFNELVREDPGCFSGMSQVLFGGESVDPGRVAQFLRGTPDSRLLHVYGPTETTTYATWHPVAPSDPASGTIPIGQPISNTTVYLLDSRLQPAPTGVSAEICIGGDGLARCYIGNPSHTAEAFIPDAVSPLAGMR
ncbi:MAG: AMP-binding protein, partial [Blastocatellia bacterium]